MIELQSDDNQNQLVIFFAPKDLINYLELKKTCILSKSTLTHFFTTLTT